MLASALTLGLWWAGPQIPRTLPYCGFDLHLDGDLAEWRSPLLTGQISLQAVAPLPAEASQVWVCWDQQALRVAVAVRDPELRPASPNLPLAQWHLHDLLQVYVDPRGDTGTRMQDDDVDVLLLPDGRSGTLRGDALLAEWSGARVPQRVSAPLQLDYAARVHAQGWTAELQLPWLGLGVPAMTGHAIRLEVALTDWRTGTDGHVRPLARSWSGDADFGWPQRWQRLQLQGAPSGWESLLQTGPRQLALWTAAALLAAIGLGAVVMWVWHRRRMRMVLTRLAPARVASPPAVADTHDRADAHPSAPAASADAEFAHRVLSHVQAHLDDDLSPAALAARFHVSLRTLQRRLRAGLDVSPQELVLAARLQAAHGWLQVEGCRVSDAAFRAGFADVSHFARRYRQAYGHAPSVRRRRSAD